MASDRITPEERRLIDEYVASGRVYRAKPGEASDSGGELLWITKSRAKGVQRSKALRRRGKG